MGPARTQPENTAFTSSTSGTGTQVCNPFMHAVLLWASAFLCPSLCVNRRGPRGGSS